MKDRVRVDFSKLSNKDIEYLLKLLGIELECDYRLQNDSVSDLLTLHIYSGITTTKIKRDGKSYDRISAILYIIRATRLSISNIKVFYCSDLENMEDPNWCKAYCDIGDFHPFKTPEGEAQSKEAFKRFMREKYPELADEIIEYEIQELENYIQRQEEVVAGAKWQKTQIEGQLRQAEERLANEETALSLANEELARLQQLKNGKQMHQTTHYLKL